MHATNATAPPPRSLLMRLLVRSWEYRYRRLMWGLRRSGALVLLVISIILFAYSSWWGLLPLVGAALAFLGGYRMYQVTQNHPAPGR